MGWESVVRVGEHLVYDVDPPRKMVTKNTISFYHRDWENPLTKCLSNDLVEVFIPVGGPSGAYKHAVVRCPDGTIEIWPRVD